MLKDKELLPDDVRSSGREDRPYTPAPSYSKVAEKLRKSSSGYIQCSLFCGGRACRYESASYWGPGDTAVRGLYSHWVTERVLAMARPSTFIFQMYDLIGQFKSVGVASVINLQSPWEHSRCGPGLEASGFTYIPEQLMSAGVFYYNFIWPDYSVPSLKALLDAVKVLDHALSAGKVAVHCHAGLGRTGLLIACHRVYSLRESRNRAVAEVRRKRPGSIQTRSQIEIIQQFSLHLSTLWTFHPPSSSSWCEDQCCTGTNTSVASGCVPLSSGTGSGKSSLSFEDLLYNQSQILHGAEQTALRHVPKVIHDVCVRLSEISQNQSCDEHNDVILHHSASHSTCDIYPNLLKSLCYHDNCTTGTTHATVEAIQVQMNSTLDWNLLTIETNPNILLSLISSFLSALKEPLLTRADISHSESIFSLPHSKCSTVKQLLDGLSSFLRQHLHCDIDQCQVSIWNTLSARLACLFLQNHCATSEDRVGLVACEGVCGSMTVELDTQTVENILFQYLHTKQWSS